MAFFGANPLVARLAHRRGYDRAAVTEITGGDLETPAALRRLAPALGWRAADLFALAQEDLPVDLAPTDWGAYTGRLMWEMQYVPAARPILLAAARSLPLLPRTRVPAPSTSYPDVPGAIIGRLMDGRNLRTTTSAQLLLTAGGPLLAAATVRGIYTGRKALDAHIVTGFARGLGIAVEDLAALCGVEVTEPEQAPEHAADVAEMMWECRRLTKEQINELDQLGHELRHRFNDDIEQGARCRCREPS